MELLIVIDPFVEPGLGVIPPATPRPEGVGEGILEEVPAAFKQWPDDVKRLKHAMDTHAVAGSRGWVVFRLADGTSPDSNTVYEIRLHAVKHMNWDRDNMIYLEIQPGGMSFGEAEAVLTFARQMHDAGFRIPDPTFDFDPVMPYQPGDRQKKIKHLASGGKYYPKGY
jgi:hypothetical protein